MSEPLFWWFQQLQAQLLGHCWRKQSFDIKNRLVHRLQSIWELPGLESFNIQTTLQRRPPE